VITKNTRKEARTTEEINTEDMCTDLLQQTIQYERFMVLAAVTMNSTVFWG
jgi:hypothetical protein